MITIENFHEMQEAAEFKQTPAGGYIGKIIAVEDKPEKEFLKISMDIANGEFAGTYQKLQDERNFWGLTSIRSYKEKARPFFKAFTNAVEKSNGGYKFEFDEKTLVGKTVGMVLQEVYYLGQDGKNKRRLEVALFVPTEKIVSGDFKTFEPIYKDGAGSTNSETTPNSFGKDIDISADIPF